MKSKTKSKNTNKKKLSRKNKILIAVTAISIISASILLCFNLVIKPQYIKKFGTNINSSKDYPIRNVEYFLQNDPLWSEDKIGSSDRRMGGYGCLISCVASAVCDLGIPIDPKDVNARLTENDGYYGADL